jgi:hypothetical protein
MGFSAKVSKKIGGMPQKRRKNSNSVLKNRGVIKKKIKMLG